MNERYEQSRLIAEIKKGHGYDYIAAHYWEMPKDDLKDVALELIYAIQDQLGDPKEGEHPLLNAVTDELTDRWDIGEEC